MTEPCPDCGLKSWNASGLRAGDEVCACDDLDEVADAECPCGNDCWGESQDWPIVTADIGGLL